MILEEVNAKFGIWTPIICTPEELMEVNLHDVEVQSKKDAAVQWCSHATRHAMSNGGKPWQYLLIPHDVITENMTITGLASAFRIN